MMAVPSQWAVVLLALVLCLLASSAAASQTIASSATGSTLYFSTSMGVGWCSFGGAQQPANISACSSQTSPWQGNWTSQPWGSFNGAITLDTTKQQLYVVNSSLISGAFVWLASPVVSTGKFQVKLAGQVSLPSRVGSQAIPLAQWLPNWFGNGTDVLALAVVTDSTLYVYLVNTHTWAIFSQAGPWISSFFAWRLGAIFVEVAGRPTLFVSSASSTNSSVAWASLVSYDLLSGNQSVVFQCNPANMAICWTQGFALDPVRSVLYFSTGWEFYSLQNNYEQLARELNLEALGTVNGVFGGAWLDAAGVYWFSDALGNTNWIVPATATTAATAGQARNELGADDGSSSIVFQGVVGAALTSSNAA